MKKNSRYYVFNVLNIFLSIVYVGISVLLIGDKYHSGILFPVILFFALILFSIALSMYDLIKNEKKCIHLKYFLLYHSPAIFAFIFSLVILLNVKTVN